jgi:hypothetical protein
MAIDTPTKVIVDCSTGEQTIEPLTAEEISALEASRVQWEADKAAEEAEATAKAALKESAKAKLIAGEPLTAEEASVLVI